MRENIIIGVLVVAIAVTVGVFFFKPATTSAPTMVSPSASTTPTTVIKTPPLQPIEKPKSLEVKVTFVPTFAHFDTVNFLSTSTYPVISGTANIPKIGIIVYDSKGTGIVGTSNVLVSHDKWTYSISVVLKPDVYTVVLFGGATNATSTLIVKNP